MANCTRCGKSNSVWNRDLSTGLCAACRSDEAAKANDEHRRQAAEAQRQAIAIRATKPVEEPTVEPFDGRAIIGISVVGAIIGGLQIALEVGAIFGFVIVGVAGMLYLAGVIRWAVSGSQFLQLNRLHRQNIEIIELLELIADKGRNAADLDLIRRLRETGQMDEEDYRKQRRKILRG